MVINIFKMNTTIILNGKHKCLFVQEVNVLSRLHPMFCQVYISGKQTCSICELFHIPLVDLNKCFHSAFFTDVAVVSCLGYDVLNYVDPTLLFCILIVKDSH